MGVVAAWFVSMALAQALPPERVSSGKGEGMVDTADAAPPQPKTIDAGLVLGAGVSAVGSAVFVAGPVVAFYQAWDRRACRGLGMAFTCSLGTPGPEAAYLTGAGAAAVTAGAVAIIDAHRRRRKRARRSPPLATAAP